MKVITEKLLNNETFNTYIKKVQEKYSPIFLLGLTDMSKSYIAGTTLKLIKKPICIVTYNELQAKEILKYCQYFSKEVVMFPKKEITTYEFEAQSKDLLYTRIEALNKMFIDKAEIVILPIESVMQPIISKDILYENILKFQVSKSYNIEEIKEKLVKLGYERCDLIEGRGQFSIRGDIIDIAVSQTEGARIELWGDEVDSIRYFNISSQRSIENLQKIEIYPANEELGETKGNVLEYINDNYIVFLDEANKIKLRMESILESNELVIKDLIDKKKKIPYVLKNMYKYQEIFSKLEKYQNIHLEKQDASYEKDNLLYFKYNDLKEIDKSFSEQINEENKKGYIKPKR